MQESTRLPLVFGLFMLGRMNNLNSKVFTIIFILLSNRLVVGSLVVTLFS